MPSFFKSPSKHASNNTTQTSLIFKTVSRSIQPPLSHRLIKQNNDLSYNINLNLIGKEKFKSLQLGRDQGKSMFVRKDRLESNKDKRNSISVREQRKNFFQEEIRKINKSKQLYKNKQKKSLSLCMNNKRSFSITHENNEQQQHDINSTIQQKYGLCQYQFRNTIKGKLLTKPNIHLKFQNQVSRQTPQTTIYYNKDLQYDLSNSKQYRKILSKFHPFQSYTPRRVFQQNKHNVFYDRIYQISQGKKITSPDRIKKIVSIQKIPGRQSDNQHHNQVKESSYLSYQTQTALEKIKKNSMKYSILHSPRDFVISKEVINKRRGCYR